MCTSLQASDSNDEDVWGDSSSEREASQEELQREGAVRGQQFFNSGYRDGLDAGKEQTLQEGFDLGFQQGAQAGFKWGCLKGAVKTLRIMSGQWPGSSQWASQVESLGSKVEGIKDREAMLGTLKQLLLTPLSDADMPKDADAEEDLMQAFVKAVRKSHDSDGLSAADGLPLPDMADVTKHVRDELVKLGFQGAV